MTALPPQGGEALGQLAPAPNTLTTLYSVPAARRAYLNYVRVTNRSAVPIHFRIAISPGGAAIADAHYVAYEEIVPVGTDVVDGYKMVPIARSLNALDVVRVHSTEGSVSFQALGGQ